MASIFISYRRKDSDIWADRLGDALREQFPDRVFMDIRQIGPGLPWRAVLDEALGNCAALLVVIGPGWLDAKDTKGNRRLEDPRDTLRREVAEALRRGVRVFPLLVSGADMPFAEGLPDDLMDLMDLQGHDLTVKHWREDVAKLIAILKQVPGLSSSQAQEEPSNTPVGSILAAAGDQPKVGSSQAQEEIIKASAGGILVVAGDHFEVLIDSKWTRSKTPTIELAPGSVFRDAPDAPEMVLIPAGTFMMGSPETETDRSTAEGPLHRVNVTKPFAMGRYAVTFDEWDACVKAGGYDHRPRDYFGRGRRPVIKVSWDHVRAYLHWLSQRTGQRYRLPSEAEWEYAARAGTTTRYPWGDEPGSNQANFDGSGSEWSGEQTAPVGSFAPNAFGLYDMIGNVEEWVEDCWRHSYDGAPTDGSAALSGEKFRVVRGGGWNDEPQFARSAGRQGSTPGYRNYDLGFRVARTLP